MAHACTAERALMRTAMCATELALVGIDKKQRKDARFMAKAVFMATVGTQAVLC